MRQLVVASTFYQCLSLAAAIDAGALPEAGERILVLANSSQAPELSPALQDHDGFAAVARRFDRVVDFAELVYPRRPVQFAPRAVELLTWQRLLRSHWDLGDHPVQLLMDSVQVNPALALAAIFEDACLYAHSDGLMTYAPTRRALPRNLSQRLSGLIHVDLIPGLVPKLLAEQDIAHLVVPRDALRQLVKEVGGDAADSSDPRPTALLLGQYLSSLQLLTREQELALLQRMVLEAARRGARLCVFKPHPSAPPTSTQASRAAASQAGVDLVVDDRAEIAEITIGRWRPSWVISCFSTGLATAQFILSTEAVAVGSRELLAKLSPYANSNRVPLVLAEALFTARGFGPPDEAEGRQPGQDLQALIDAVAYCMQPELLTDSIDRASEYLSSVAGEPAILETFFGRRRLAALGLPGGLPKPTRRTQARRWVGRRVRDLTRASVSA